jgi:hypothetical protein
MTDLISFFKEWINKPFGQYTMMDGFAVLLLFIFVVILWGIFERWFR